MTTVAASDVRGMSSFVTTTARGVPSAAHSSHSDTVIGSMSSAAETTNRAESAARSPARNSPVKSG